VNNHVEFVVEEFTINDGSSNREEHPRIVFAIQDTSISDRFNTNFDYTPDDITTNKKNTSTTSSRDITKTFPLNFTNLNISNNLIRVSNNRRIIRLKDGAGDDTNARIVIEDVVGGTARFTENGRGIEVTGNVTARINLDVDDNPDTNGVSLDAVEINGVTFNRIGSRGEAAKTVRFNATENVTTTVDQPVDFVESNATQRQRVVPDERYDVRGFVAKTGDALVNELRVDPGGKTVRADGETRRIEIRQREIEVRDEAEEVYVVFDNLHPKNTIQTVLEGGDKTLRLRDGDGDDANAKLEIKGGNAVFAIAETEKSLMNFQMHQVQKEHI
jgi:hypothetical protein